MPMIEPMLAPAVVNTPSSGHFWVSNASAEQHAGRSCPRRADERLSEPQPGSLAVGVLVEARAQLQPGRTGQSSIFSTGLRRMRLVPPASSAPLRVATAILCISSVGGSSDSCSGAGYQPATPPAR